MTESYTDILTTSWNELPKPQLLPLGSWLLKGKNAVYFPKKEGEDKNARVAFFYKAVEPMADVLETELEALGPDYDFQMNDLSHQIWIESSADWQKKVYKFLEKHAGWTPGANPQEALKNFQKTEVVAYMGERSYVRDGETVTDNSLSTFVNPSAVA